MSSIRDAGCVTRGTEWQAWDGDGGPNNVPAEPFPFVGSAMATHLRTDLVLGALNMALAQRRPESVIHHSDQGCQYTSFAFGKRCQEVGVMPSMGSVGDAYDSRKLLRDTGTRSAESQDFQDAGRGPAGDGPKRK